MSLVYFWKCELASSALAKLKEALAVEGVEFDAAEPVHLELRQINRGLVEGSLSLEKPLESMTMLLGQWGKDGKGSRWIVIGQEAFEVSPEIDSLLGKIHHGTMRTRQTVKFEADQGLYGASKFQVGTISVANTVLGVLLRIEGGSIEACESVMGDIVPLRLFPELTRLRPEKEITHAASSMIVSIAQVIPLLT